MLSPWIALFAIALLVAAGAALGAVWRVRRGRLVAASSRPRVDAAALGIELGKHATLLQFSTRTCAHCGPARANLSRLAATQPGVEYREVDLTDDLATAERYDVRSTPTLFVLDASGRLLRRSSGPPRLDELAKLLVDLNDEVIDLAAKERLSHAI